MRLFARHAVGRTPANCACVRCDRPARLPSSQRHVVATSEFWWEDEQEYDAVTEMLAPKKVYILVSTSSNDALTDARQQMSDVRFQTGFTGSKTQQAADTAWEGRCAPPYFYKMRSRDALDTLSDPGVSVWEDAAEGFWRELTGQNWRVELDHGLQVEGKEEGEAVLVVTSSLAADRLLRHAVGLWQPSPAEPYGGQCFVVGLSGWSIESNTGKPMSSWRELSPALTLAAELQQ